MSNIQKNELYFCTKRDEFIAALVTNDYSGINNIYKSVISKAEPYISLSENMQKALNQIQSAFNVLFDATQYPETKTLYDQHAKLRKILSTTVRNQNKNINHIEFNTWINTTGITKRQMRILFKTTSVFQITSGCSNYCRRCNEWAIPGVRKHFSFKAIKMFSDVFFDCGNTDYILYGASDPLDWKEGGKTIVDIVSHMYSKSTLPGFGLLTKVPLGKENILKKLLNTGTDISVSVTSRNRKRIHSIEGQTGTSISRQHDHDDLLIPAGLDEDFTSVKPSITDNYGTEITPDGAFIVIPTFTSALNLTGQHRIPVTRDTNFFLAKKTGRSALTVEYFKPLEAIDLDGRRFTLKRLLDPQIENLILDNGTYDLTPPGMISIKEYFSTYEKTAVRKRKAIMPSIIKNIKKDLLKNGSYKNSQKSTRQTYLNHIRKYIDFCIPLHIERAKMHMISFYLKEISDYLVNNPFKRKILIHLTSSTPDDFATSRFNLKERSINSFLKDDSIDPYELFQYLTQTLLQSPDDQHIQEFIQSHKSIYDPFSGRFTHDPGE